MSKRKRSAKHVEPQGLRAANPELFQSPPGAEWESRGLLNRRSDPINSTGFIYQFSIPERYLIEWPRNIPQISFGENAPVPRWRFASATIKPPRGKDLNKDLIRTVAGKSVIDGLTSESHPRSFDSSIGLGGLQWVFDPGLPAISPNMVHGRELYEVAYNCLIEALRNPICRAQMKREIANGSLWPEVCNVEDPLPPPPKRPKTNFYTGYGEDDKGTQARREADDYKRPVPIPRARGSTPAKDSEPTYADRLLYHDKGADGPLHQADPRKVLGFESDNSEDEGQKDGKIAKIGTSSESNIEGGLPNEVETAMETAHIMESIVAETRREKKDREKGGDAKGRTGPRSNAAVVNPLTNKSRSKKATRSKATTKKTASKKVKEAAHEGPIPTGTTRSTKSALKKGPKQTPKKNVAWDISDSELKAAGGYREVVTRVSHMSRAKKDISPVNDTMELCESDDDSDSVPEANISKRFPTVASGEVNATIDDNSDYIQTFKEACKSSQDRKKYFPLPKAIRRIRPWAGTKLPREIEQRVREILPKMPTAYRPFSSRQKPEHNGKSFAKSQTSGRSTRSSDSKMHESP